MTDFFSPSTFNPATAKPPKVVHASAIHRCLQGNMAMTAAMLVNDRIVLGQIPSHAVILPASTIIHDALGAATTYDIGFLEQGPAVLAAAQSAVAAGVKSGVAGVTAANIGKAAWELAGYASDPRTSLTLILTIKAGAVTTPGRLFYEYDYVSGS